MSESGFPDLSGILQTTVNQVVGETQNPGIMELANVSQETQSGDKPPVLNMKSLIDRVLGRKNLSPDARGDGYFSPSALPYCTRACVYQYIKTPKFPKKLRIEDWLNMIMGNAVHDIIQAILEDSKDIFFHKEALAIHPSLPIVGSCDGVINYPRNSKWFFGLEIKSMRESRWLTMSGTNSYIKKTVKAQFNTYMGMLNLPVGFVVLWNKNTGNYDKWYRLEFDPKAYQATEALVQNLMKLADEKKFPPKQKGNCNFCHYVEPCQKDWTFEQCDRRHLNVL
jgi:CRISPR/Cas system-associated exonuclease Cas4 (RecB family)